MKLVNYWDKYIEMHGQQNVKIYGFVTTKDEVLPFKAHWWLLTLNKTRNVRIKVTTRCVRANIVAVEKHFKYYIFWVYVCILIYPSCNAHAPCWHTRMWSGWLCNIHEHKSCVSIFSANFVWHISHSTNNSVRYDHKCISVYMHGTHNFFPNFNEKWIFSTDFR